MLTCPVRVLGPDRMSVPRPDLLSPPVPVTEEEISRVSDRRLARTTRTWLARARVPPEIAALPPLTRTPPVERVRVAPSLTVRVCEPENLTVCTLAVAVAKLPVTSLCPAPRAEAEVTVPPSTP